MNSSMIATEPLPESVWDAIGWDGRETLGDMAHAYMYAQRTADDRIAFGGRGVPYRYGSRTDNDGRTQPAHHRRPRATSCARFFPTTAAVPIDHAWSGVLGVPRDWSATVSLDRTTGLGWAGGYVGSGVTTTNLAARTLRDLILGCETELTRCPGSTTGPEVGTRTLALARRPRHLRRLSRGRPRRVPRQADDLSAGPRG